MRFRSKLEEGFQESLDAKVGQGRSEENRCQLASQNRFFREFIPSFAQELNIFLNLIIKRVRSKQLIAFCQSCKALLTLIKLQPLIVEVINTLKALPHANRPIHRIASNTQNLFQFFQQIQRLATVTIQLVHKSEDWNIPMLDNLKELLSLSLNTLSRVNNHDRSIHRHQSPISIF